MGSPCFQTYDRSRRHGIWSCILQSTLNIQLSISKCSRRCAMPGSERFRAADISPWLGRERGEGDEVGVGMDAVAGGVDEGGGDEDEDVVVTHFLLGFLNELCHGRLL